MSLITANGVCYSDDLRWRIVWKRCGLNMKVTDIAKTMLELTGSVSPFQRKNGPDRLLTEVDEALLVQRILDQPGVCLKELGQSLLLLRGVDVDESLIWRALQKRTKKSNTYLCKEAMKIDSVYGRDDCIMIQQCLYGKKRLDVTSVLLCENMAML